MLSAYAVHQGTSCWQVWMCAHPPQRGHPWLGTRPKVHTGFHRAWTADGLHTEVMDCLQVRQPGPLRAQPKAGRCQAAVALC